MNNPVKNFLLPALLLAAALPSAALPPLPVPLTLPPGLRQVLPIVKAQSYIGDAVRIVDCPLQSQNPYGLCDNWLFGGYAMWDSHISGDVQLQFYKAINNVAHFEISHPGNLKGDDTIMQAPQGYEARVRNNFVLDALDNVSSGDLNLLTGEVTNLKYYTLISNSWYGDLTTVNPRLKPPDFQFPGIYGSNQFKFAQRADGLLDLTVEASTFLPLNSQIDSEPVNIPLAYCGATADCAGIQAPGSSLHPHIYFTTIDHSASDVPCGAKCANITPNSFQTFEAQTYFTSFGDHFTVVVPQLGGQGNGRTHLQGRVQVQWGPQTGNHLPVAITMFPQSGFIAPIPSAPPPLSTFQIKMFGHDEYLHFPFLTYVTAQAVDLEDDFDVSVGAINTNTGKSFTDVLSRIVPGQTLFNTIIGLNITRIPLDTFRFRGPLYVARGANGASVVGFDGNYKTNFDSFLFPAPDYSKPSLALSAGPGSFLDPFWRFQGVRTVDQPRAAKTNSGNYVSAFNQPFTYSYSLSCDPSVGTGSFDFTNNSFTPSNGSFHMENVSSVSCTNSKNSTAAPGDYDTITLVGYGTWSRDINNGRHVVTMQDSYPADLPHYLSIQIDGGVLSNVHLKPPQDTIP